MRIHLVFHVSLLEPFKGDTKDSEISYPYSIGVNCKKKYWLEKILASRIGGRSKKKKQQYLVKWEGYPSSNNTWEDKDNVKKAKTLDSFL